MPSNSKKFSSRSKSREFVLQTLYQLVVHWQVSPEMPLSEKQSCQDLSVEYVQGLIGFKSADNDFYLDILLNCIEKKEICDEILNKYLDRNILLISIVEYCILWMSIYQLSERWDIPRTVVINESLELAKLFGGDNSFKFINATTDLLAKDLHPENEEVT